MLRYAGVVVVSTWCDDCISDSLNHKSLGLTG